MGAKLYISPATSRTYVSRLLAKLQARDRAQLVVLAYETGLIQPGTPSAPGRSTEQPGSEASRLSTIRRSRGRWRGRCALRAPNMRVGPAALWRPCRCVPGP
ncbi:response regulator transcription factor [Arthrobacter sp. TB 23]|uniref:response regulator transcription factor n=1 Tax=Arthrobacter sp. TB 23 TaxID=494419 RepID=UPI001ED91FB0|nr:hypothetical protein [Arthrobacter sp. TB 23]